MQKAVIYSFPNETETVIAPADRLSHGLQNLGFAQTGAVHHNLRPAALYEMALQRGEAQLTADGTLVAYTAPHTGRSPNDKYIVQDTLTEGTVDWGDVNQPTTPEIFSALLQRMQEWAAERELFVQDLHAGADKSCRVPVRIITQYAWHSLFARNMFIRPTPSQAEDFTPSFTVIALPEFTAIPAIDQTRSGTFIMLDLIRRIALIGGTAYAGEIKKAVFTALNYILPRAGVMPMHASANMGPDGDVAVFFGLSGTGKTTLSVDKQRTLIGDDEHAWTDTAICNFEGGCYAKAIRLNARQEPEIYDAARRFGAVLENVAMDAETRAVDFDNPRHAENSRVCYPIHFIKHASTRGVAGVPQHVIMLTCDAFGVLPPLSRLSPAQALYHFLSGYTARVAGTERGVIEPQAVFSACFGAPFMPRAPTVYAKLLGEKITKHDVQCWLVNTGWVGGGPGVGNRIPLPMTRALLNGIFSGSLLQTPFMDDGVFGLPIPIAVADVPYDVLTPERAWQDQAAYKATAQKVARLFAENFRKFENQVDDAVRKAAMRGA